MKSELLKRDWEKDHVYLVQFPRCGCIPTPSPFALKLETWLRMMDIPYTNVSNNFTKMSSKGQIPFIELNGRQIADSNISIQHMKQELGKDPDASLSPSEKSLAKAYHALIEDSLRWVIFFERSTNNKWWSTEKGWINNLTGIKKTAFKLVLAELIRRKLAKTVFIQGIGRHSKAEVAQMAKDDIRALSVFLADKQYLLGDKPTTLDATAFGNLAQLYYAPIVMTEIKDYIDKATPNLVRFTQWGSPSTKNSVIFFLTSGPKWMVSYLERIRGTFWPDWEEATTKLSMNSNWKKV